MIRFRETYDLEVLLAAIRTDIQHQQSDAGQHKKIAQETITELMLENIRKRHKKHD